MNYFTKDFFDFKGFSVKKIRKDESEIMVYLVPRRKTAICPKCQSKTKNLYDQSSERKVKRPNIWLQMLSF